MKICKIKTCYFRSLIGKISLTELFTCVAAAFWNKFCSLYLFLLSLSWLEKNSFHIKPIYIVMTRADISFELWIRARS